MCGNNARRGFIYEFTIEISFTSFKSNYVKILMYCVIKVLLWVEVLFDFKGCTQFALKYWASEYNKVPRKGFFNTV